MKRIIRSVGVTSAIALLAAVMFTPAAVAGEGDVVARGGCSAASDWKLKLSPEDGQIEVEIEVDQNVVGDRWRVKIAHNGTLEYKFKKRTKAPSGSFEARRLVSDTGGTDRIRVRSINLSTGEVCVAKARI